MVQKKEFSQDDQPVIKGRVPPPRVPKTRGGYTPPPKSPQPNTTTQAPSKKIQTPPPSKAKDN